MHLMSMVARHGKLAGLESRELCKWIHDKIFDARSIFQKGLCVCVSVCRCNRVCVTLLLQICKMQKNTREKVHSLSARDFYILMRQNGYVSENSGDFEKF